VQPGEGSGGSFSRRTPHVLLTEAEVKEAVDDLLRSPWFVIDVETTSLNSRTNDVLWVGLGAFGRVYLIPMGHPKGVTLAPEHKAKRAAFLHYPEGDPRGLTPVGGKPSLRMVEYTEPAVYDDPPQQLFPDTVFPLLQPLLFSDKGKVGHNVKFDLSSCAKYYGGVIPPGPYHDSIMSKHTLVEDLMSYELKPLVCDWFQIPQEKRKKFYPNLGKAGIENFGLDEVARYLAKDVRYSWMLWNRDHNLLIRKGLESVYEFEMQVYPVIMEMERVGFPVDLTELNVVRDDLNRRIGEVEQEAYKIAGDEFSLSDLGAKRWVLFGKGIPEYGKSKRKLKTQKLRVLTVTAKEKLPSVTAAVLDFHAERGNRMAELLSEWAGLEKLRGTFVEGITGFLNHHGDDLPTIHTGYKQHGTVTGRLSASQPNLQQLPRGSTIRKLFVSGPGQVLIVADYDQVELRCAGYLSGDTNMLRVFSRGEDIHRQAAAAMFGVPLDQVTDDMRAVGKTQNFAVLYGAGEGKIAAVAGCSIDRAVELIAGYFRTFPKINDWKYWELQQARKRGDRANPLGQPPHVLIPPYGRMRRLPDLFVMDGMTDDEGESIVWRRYRAERQAINAIVQGFASYITKLAMIDLSREVPWPMLAQVHDEIIFRVPEDEAYKVLPLIQEVMGGILDPRTGEPILGEIPLVASAAYGTSWADAKKKAS
jgi:DNA polymerase-1